jgi:hypothetical protein
MASGMSTVVRSSSVISWSGIVAVKMPMVDCFVAHKCYRCPTDFFVTYVHDRSVIHGTLFLPNESLHTALCHRHHSARWALAYKETEV